LNSLNGFVNASFIDDFAVKIPSTVSKQSEQTDLTVKISTGEAWIGPVLLASFTKRKLPAKNIADRKQRALASSGRVTY